MKTAVIVRGNPAYTKTALARNFYNSLRLLLKKEGYVVGFDDGEPYTCPTKSDLYIMHSRGCDRLVCLDNKFKQTKEHAILMGSHLKGAINHPIDDKWMKDKPPNVDWDEYGLPPKEHFILTEDMANQIRSRIRKLKDEDK